MTEAASPLRIFVGTEPSQVVAHQVLAHSISAHASVPVDVTPMLDVPIPVPADPANRARVGFTFTRFLIPSLCGFEGRAVYMDADMLVFGDVAELADLAFGPHRVLCTYQRDRPEAWKDKAHFRFGRHTAVMVLDCGRLAWDAAEVVAGLDQGRYTYEDLVYDLCVVPDAEVGDTLPPEWNHLERHQPGVTRLLHYTVVRTQPWKNDKNPLAGLWLAAFAAALEAGAVAPEEVEDGIAKGHLKPSLADFLHLAPSRRSAAGDAVAPRQLALARAEIARLQRQVQVMRSSREWRIGEPLARALHASRQVVEQARDRLSR